jgi:hypothetical protein
MENPMPDDSTVPPRSPCPTATDAERLLATLAAVFDDEAGFGPRLTVAAAGALNLLAGYLSTCLGPAQAAAAPSPDHLAEILLALHIAALSLHKRLTGTVRALDQRRLRAAVDVDLAQVLLLRGALDRAGHGLLGTAQALADAHRALTGTDTNTDSAARPRP